MSKLPIASQQVAPLKIKEPHRTPTSTSPTDRGQGKCRASVGQPRCRHYNEGARMAGHHRCSCRGMSGTNHHTPNWWIHGNIAISNTTPPIKQANLKTEMLWIKEYNHQLWLHQNIHPTSIVKIPIAPRSSSASPTQENSFYIFYISKGILLDEREVEWAQAIHNPDPA